MEILIPLFVLLLPLAIPVALLASGYFVGRYSEQQHFASIESREARLARLPILPTRQWDRTRAVADARLVTGSVVIAADYFNQLVAKFRNLVGGRISGYERLLDRARREAVLRLKEQCPEADLIVNLRIETSTISSRHRESGIASIELLAYGTAIRYRA